MTFNLIRHNHWMVHSCESQPRPGYVDLCREIQSIIESVTLFVQDVLSGFASHIIRVPISGGMYLVYLHMIIITEK